MYSSDRGDVVSLFTNHPKVGDIVAFNQALCALYAAGLGQRAGRSRAQKPAVSVATVPLSTGTPNATPLTASASCASTPA